MSAVLLSALRTDGGTQPRASLRRDWIEEYALDMASGAAFPPVTVFFDGAVHWLADGFHRTHAAMALGRKEIEADIRQGTQRDAILFSVSANGSHGQRRTNEDKRRAVTRLLDDAEWSGWSNREIARQCGVDDKTVASLRPAKPEPLTAEIRSEERTYTNKYGTTSQMNTANIGRRPEPPPFEPPARAPTEVWPMQAAPSAPADPWPVYPEETREQPPAPAAWTPDQLDRRARAEAGECVVATLRGQADAVFLAWAEQEGRYVRIDRKTDWGNPFEMPGDGNRDEVIELFTKFYWPHKKRLLREADGLAGKVLGCWCHPEPCHGHLIAECVNRAVSTGTSVEDIADEISRTDG